MNRLQRLFVRRSKKDDKLDRLMQLVSDLHDTVTRLLADREEIFALQRLLSEVKTNISNLDDSIQTKTSSVEKAINTVGKEDVARLVSASSKLEAGVAALGDKVNTLNEKQDQAHSMADHQKELLDATLDEIREEYELAVQTKENVERGLQKVEKEISAFRKEDISFLASASAKLEAEITDLGERIGSLSEKQERANSMANRQKELLDVTLDKLNEDYGLAVEAKEDIEGELQNVEKEINKLGKQQFRVNNISESQTELLNKTLGEIKREQEIRTDQVTAMREANEQIGQEAKTNLIMNLLPMVDALEEGISTGRAVVEHRISKKETEEGDASTTSWWRRIIGGAAPPGGITREEQEALDNWLEGTVLLHKRLSAILAKEKVTPIESLGQTFDPNLHTAVETVPADDIPTNTIVEEQLKGYLVDGKVLRYAEVVVAKVENEASVQVT